MHPKEVRHPKFYLFDNGVARACAGLLTENVDAVWRGFAFESYLLQELRAYNSYHQKKKDFFYYRISGGDEIDLLIETKKKTLFKRRELLALEIKNSPQWDRRWSKKLNEIASHSESGIQKIIGIYRGTQILTQENVQIYPVEVFLEELKKGAFF